MTDNDAFDARVRMLRRKAATSRAAYAMHKAHPDMAREAGAKGGAARVARMRDPRAYGQWLARRRYYGELAGPPPE